MGRRIAGQIAAKMARPLAAAVAAGLVGAPAAMAAPDPRLAAEAKRVTITRDDWGIAHVHGRTDADAVFGMIYAQAEDDFGRIEANYLTALGRTAEAAGQGALYEDLRQRLFVDPARLKRLYAQSPAHLKALMVAWADGLNWYLATHPQVRPKVLTRFEPWMALSFTEGSIGGDVTKVSAQELKGFYEHPDALTLARAQKPLFEEPTGSNGMAIAPSRTRDGHALLLINPHTTFYFRSELQVSSEAGLNAYGAATWGQFFVYQGFNAHAGWMHTTSAADCVDEFAETVERRGGRLMYRYGAAWRPVTVGRVTLKYRTAAGALAEKTFTTWRTHHGPIVRRDSGKWIAVALMDRPIAALEQSFYRTKATDLAGFLKVADKRANSSNDTLFADDKGEIALLMPQFVPQRDDRFDYTRPVDGADPATDWKGDTPLSKLPSVIRPANGWVYNSNDGPWWSAGKDSPSKAAYPRYVDAVGRNARTPHAVEVLSTRGPFTLDGLVGAAFDPHLPAFDTLIPALVAAWEALPPTDPQRARLAEPVAALKGWDRRWSADSVPTHLAVAWAEAMWAKTAPMTRSLVLEERFGRVPPLGQLEALSAAVTRIERDFGTWRTPWGEANRFQRLDDAQPPHFDDSQPSLPVPFTSANWGSLASFAPAPDSGTKKRYGVSGNSFVAAVEFGPRVKARAVTAGGESGDPSSPHFQDEAQRYASGNLRPVYFYADELKGHTARTYRPGE